MAQRVYKVSEQLLLSEHRGSSPTPQAGDPWGWEFAEQRQTSLGASLWSLLPSPTHPSSCPD